MSTSGMSNKDQQLVNGSAQQQLASIHAKNAELLAKLNEFEAQQNVSVYLRDNDNVIVADEVAPHILHAEVAFYAGHPMIEQKLVPSGKKDDYGRKTQRYGTYEIKDFADLLGFVNQEFDKITVSNLEKLVGNLNPEFVTSDGKHLRIRIEVGWEYSSQLDMVGHKTKLVGIKFPNLDKFAPDSAARKCARFVLSL